MQASSPFSTLPRPMIVAMLGILASSAIMAQDTVPQSAPAQATPAPTAPAQMAPRGPLSLAPTPTDVKQREQELEKLRGEQRKAQENEVKLKREIESLGDDRKKFNQQIIEAASRVVTVEDTIARTQTRLESLDDRERLLRSSLDLRRDVVADVLAALQRMSRRSPPALMVRTEDALTAVRSAMVLGAILPEMRQQAEALAADLGEITELRGEMTAERARLGRDLLTMTMERHRLSLMIDERQKRLGDAERALTDERQRAAQLGRQAEDLNQLITKLEQGLENSARSARAATGVGKTGPDLAALKDAGRLTPAVAFAAAKGMLPLPVSGARIKEFGASDGLGGTEKGLSIATRPSGQITAPCDGWVVYAGVFRNYGQLLILNAGGGYHVLLAGMERISVDLGQFVVTGEPVAVMGGGAQSAAVTAGGSGQPVLYIEFRKDGIPVDPGPWWAANEGQKVRG
jgi:murein hydrolase activator